MLGKFSGKAFLIICAAVVAVLATTCYMGFRAKRTYSVLRDWQAQVRHQMASGGTIGTAPAAKTFEASYLEAVFGSDPDLLGQMKALIAKGLAEDPTINLGEVTAMLVTYMKSPAGKVEDVAVHVLGGFAVGRRRPGLNHDGFFAAQVDRNLWNTGNSVLSLLGRDMIVFADPQVSHLHDELLESTLSGDIMPLVGVLTNRPLYYTTVFPDPRRVLPTQLRTHVQALVMKGHLSPDRGSYEMMLLAKDPRSASYTLAIADDLRLAASLALKTRFDGVLHKTKWGDHASTWWAVEWAHTVDEAVLAKEQNVISLRTAFERKMVNASLKSIERMGRDMAAARLIRDERLDPRLADKQLQSTKPAHYWSEPHKWGPDWPFPPPGMTNGAVPTPSARVPVVINAPLASRQN